MSFAMRHRKFLEHPLARIIKRPDLFVNDTNYRANFLLENNREKIELLVPCD